MESPTQVSSLQKGEECCGGYSSTLLGQTLLCSDIILAEFRGAVFENRTGTDSELEDYKNVTQSVEHLKYIRAR